MHNLFLFNWVKKWTKLVSSVANFIKKLLLAAPNYCVTLQARELDFFSSVVIWFQFI
jgi:hypothetical protein